MEWHKKAEEAIKKVPFFVRKKVRLKIEQEVINQGKNIVTLIDVKTAQKNFLNKMDSDITGYKIEICFGNGGCPNQAVQSEQLEKKLHKLFMDANLLTFLRNTVSGQLKYHHEFRVAIADCPNACSQPQIKDIGIIGVSQPTISEKKCSFCFECVNICKENAIELDKTMNHPEINRKLCLNCKECIKVCPTKTLMEEKYGYRVLIGGKLGRHPKLAKYISGIKSENQVVEIVKVCLEFYKNKSVNGKRFAAILNDNDNLNEYINKI